MWCPTRSTLDRRIGGEARRGVRADHCATVLDRDHHEVDPPRRPTLAPQRLDQRRCRAAPPRRIREPLWIIREHDLTRREWDRHVLPLYMQREAHRVGDGVEHEAAGRRERAGGGLRQTALEF